MIMAVEGMVASLATREGFFILLSPDRTRLALKYAAGEIEPAWKLPSTNLPTLHLH